MDLNFDLQPMQFSHFTWICCTKIDERRKEKKKLHQYRTQFDTISYWAFRNICTKALCVWERNSLVFWLRTTCHGRKVDQTSMQFPFSIFQMLILRNFWLNKYTYRRPHTYVPMNVNGNPNIHERESFLLKPNFQHIHLIFRSASNQFSVKSYLLCFAFQT